MAIPSSLVASFGFFYFFGFTLNTMTLMALSLSIGMLIDDAIVVLENVYRHMEGGTPAKEAASKGTDEIEGYFLAKPMPGWKFSEGLRSGTIKRFAPIAENVRPAAAR